MSTTLPLHNGTSGSTLRPETPSGGSRPISHSRSRSRVNRPAASAITSSYAILTPEETAERLETSLDHGLPPTEAQSRLITDGTNVLPHEEPEPLWLRFLKQFRETLILLLLASAGVSLLMGNYEDGVSIAVAVTIVVTVGFVQEYRSEKSLEALNSLVPHYAHVMRGAGASGATRKEPVVKENGSGIEMTHLRKTSMQSVDSETKSTTIPASDLVAGDLVLFQTGDRIPADIRITQAADLSIDESNLTGENEPVQKHPEVIRSRLESSPLEPAFAGAVSGTVGVDIRLNDQHNIVFMGTLVRSGYGQGIVIGTGGDTEFGAISTSLQEIESPRTPLQLSMDRLGKDLSYMSFAVIAFIMLLGLMRGWKFMDMFQIGVSLAVAAIPEGLPIIVTVTLALGVLRMSKREAIVRRLPSVETLGSVNVICSDKTGTLTTNHMTVTKLWHFDDKAPVDVMRKQGLTSLDAATRKLLRIGNIVNNARLYASSTNATPSSAAVLASTQDDASNLGSRWAGQPTDVALLDLLDSFSEEDVRERIGSRRNETPFSSERKWMGVVIHGSGTGTTAVANPSDVAYIKGALEQVLKRCDTYITTDGKEIVLDEARRTEVTKAAESMADEGLRVLGFASGPVKDARNKTKTSKSGTSTPSGTTPHIQVTIPESNEHLYTGLAFAGLVGMNDPPRKGVDRSIRRLIAGGVKVIMITGDAEATAVAIGKKLGMPISSSSPDRRPVLRGEQLDRMTESELAQAMGSTAIFARTSPEHKMKIVRALQARGDVVAMTGDGVNDAPALKQADIGISMGKLGTDVAKEAADMILTDDDFSTILNAIEEGKGIFYNIQNFLTFQLSTSAAALSLVLLATVFGFKNPLNAMQILWINILMDGPPAQSLGVEPVDPAVMSRPPRSKSARVLTRRLLERVLQSSSVIMLGTLFVYIHEMARDNTVTARDTTMTFTCFVLFDMWNALACRSEAKSVLRGEIGLFSNRMFNLSVAGSLLGQALVIYFPPLQRIFQTEALSIWDLIRLTVVASTVFWADEARKYLKRRGGFRAVFGSGYSRSV